MRKKIIVVVAVLIVIAIAAPVLWRKARGTRSVASVVARDGPDARERLEPHFTRAGVAWPPDTPVRSCEKVIARCPRVC
ncbi:MAG TPA: hypothetical protein VGQ76_27870, partial [Thermoanaerobaculia bacterium]|nr:hypothetical protein [Thermoanaerobaculia bacterium]